MTKLHHDKNWKKDWERRRKQKMSIRGIMVYFGILGSLVFLSQVVTFVALFPRLLHKQQTQTPIEIQEENKDPLSSTNLRIQNSIAEPQKTPKKQKVLQNLLKKKMKHLEEERNPNRIIMQQETDAETEAEEEKHVKVRKRGNKSLDPRVKPLMELAGIPLTSELIDELPQWKDIDDVYEMDEPKIIGLETCPVFMDKWRDTQHVYIAPAGLFDTGTNMLARLLRRNCIFPPKPNTPERSMHFQVPWGKHNPHTAFRFHHVCEEDRNMGVKLPQERVLPVVMIKDPYTWMSSICRHKYYTNWPHTKQHCPNLMPDKTDVMLFSEHRGVKPNEQIPVRVHFSDEIRGKYQSMTDMWNDWNNEYLTTGSKGGEQDFPRIMVRYEDLLYYPVEVVTKLCECLEGKTRKDFVLISEPAKGNQGVHEGSHGYQAAFIRYSDELQRLDNYHTQDLDYAKESLDENLMKLFGYKHPTSSLIKKHNIHPHEEYTGPFPIQ